MARALAVAREGSEEGIANATLVKHPFNAQHERCARARSAAKGQIICLEDWKRLEAQLRVSCKVQSNHLDGSATCLCVGDMPAAGSGCMSVER